MLYKERSTNGAGIHFILIGLMIFLASWQVIKIVEYHEVKKATEVESRRLSTLISGRLMTDINDIRALYSKANHQNHTTYQAFVGYLNDYFRKMHSLESITFYYNNTTDKSTSFYNPYSFKGLNLVSKDDCDLMLKRQPEKSRTYRKMLVMPVLDHLCLYDEDHQIVSVINLRTTIRYFLNSEIKKGYFLTLIDSGDQYKTETSHFALENTTRFSFLGTDWVFKVYPSAAYIELKLKNAYLFSTLLFCLFLLIFLGMGRLYQKGFHQLGPVDAQELGYLRKLALYDQVTNLPNREYFLEHLDATLSRAERHHINFALCYMDCDNFKVINDTYGHHVGDQVLKHVGEVVLKKIRKHDFFSRLSGDEFCLILENIKSKHELQLIIDKLSKAIARPFLVEGHVISMSISIGTAMYPEQASSQKTLMIYADKAMYEEKKVEC